MRTTDGTLRTAMRAWPRVLVVCVVAASAGCGGGGASAVRDTESDRPPSDPKLRLAGIVEQADTALLPSAHVDYSVRALGLTLADRLAEDVQCSETRCIGVGGSEWTLDDFPLDTLLEQTRFDSRSGFDTVIAEGGAEVVDYLEGYNDIPGLTFSSVPSATHYGLWSRYGYAGTFIWDGPMSVKYAGVTLRGDMSATHAFVIGDAAGTNPVGTGGATWRGIAEVVSTDTFERQPGSSTVSIADLSEPLVRVEIEVSGNSVGSSAWTDMALSDGRYESGVKGLDYLTGNFHGSDHDEVYGVFDTAAYVGAFGAKRDP